MAKGDIKNPAVLAACITAASRVIAADVQQRQSRKDGRRYQEGDMASEIYELAAILFGKFEELATKEK